MWALGNLEGTFGTANAGTETLTPIITHQEPSNVHPTIFKIFPPAWTRVKVCCIAATPWRLVFAVS